jgi:peptide/nickel transport system substrate-binding protein
MGFTPDEAHDADGVPFAFAHPLTRRRLIHGAMVGGAAVAGSGFLAACGAGGNRSNPSAAQVDTRSDAPKRGGRLRVGHVGGGKGESYDPGLASNMIAVSRMNAMYDPLIRVNPDLSTSPGLALEWNPNKEATVWEIVLRPDVTFHNGKSFTADDVIYTLRSMGDPKHAGHSSVTNIRLRELKKLDDLTVRVPLTAPNARLFDSFVILSQVMIQDGHKDFSKPVGTGPFMFKSFTPGERSLAVRNPNYWEEGKPYLDELEDISIPDDSARVNALLSGEIDALSQMPLTQARAHQQQGDIQIIDAPSPSVQVLLMAVDKAPFDDKRVRQAFRLIADRPALIERALNGYGTVGNDLVGKGLPYYADDLPQRAQDLEQAKSLLKSAGQSDLRVTLQTSTSVPGFVEAATLFAEQAKGAGVAVNVKKEPADAYFDTSLLYTKMTFGQSFWQVTSVSGFYEQALMSDAVWNETHWREKSTDQQIRSALAATSEGDAKQLWHDVQQSQYDDGGYIVWSNLNLVDAAAKNVRGIVPSSFIYLGGFDFRGVSLA